MLALWIGCQQGLHYLVRINGGLLHFGVGHQVNDRSDSLKLEHLKIGLSLWIRSHIHIETLHLHRKERLFEFLVIDFNPSINNECKRCVRLISKILMTMVLLAVVEHRIAYDELPSRLPLFDRLLATLLRLVPVFVNDRIFFVE